MHRLGHVPVACADHGALALATLRDHRRPPLPGPGGSGVRRPSPRQGHGRPAPAARRRAPGHLPAARPDPGSGDGPGRRRAGGVAGAPDRSSPVRDQPRRGRPRRRLHRRGRPAGPGAHRRPERTATAPGGVAGTGGSVIEDPASLSSSWGLRPGAPVRPRLRGPHRRPSGGDRPAARRLAAPAPAGQVHRRPHGGRLQPGSRRPGGHRRSPGTRRGRGRSTVGRDRGPPGSQPRSPGPPRAGPGPPRRPPPAAAGLEGTWPLGIESDPVVVGGFWTAERRQDVVELVLDILRGWRPTGLPPVMAVVTRLAPVFRSWPTTYRWRGTVTLGNQPTLTARWERTGDQPDQSSRRLTSPHSR
jgi:hypothetical protein